MSSDVAELERAVTGTPADWRQVTLGKVVRIVTDGISVADLAALRKVHHYSLPAFDDGAGPEVGPGDTIKSNKTVVPDDCVLFSKLNPRIPRIWRVRGDAPSHSYCSTEFWPLVAQGSGVDLDYLTQYLSSAAFLGHPDITPSSSTNSHQRVDRKAFERFEFALPPLDEQRRIAEVLRSVDEALHTARQVADQCEQVLRVELDGIAARLFADETPQVKLGAVARVKGGKRLPKGSEYSDEPTRNPYIRVTDWQDYEIRTGDLRYISDEIARSIWRYTISASDIFISIAGSVGLVATVPESLEGAYLTENAAKICINDPNTLDTTYLLAVLRSGALADQIAKHKGVGGGVPKLALFRIEDLDIPVPDMSLQIEIGETYDSLRASVEAARAAVGQLDATRKEVMSDLLSGRVRVPA